MRYRLAVEDIEPDHWVAWALDLPACFSSAPTQMAAVAHAPDRIAEYYTWLSTHDSTLPVMSRPFEAEVVETFHSLASSEDPEYLVNAFFEDDRRPLDYWDVEVALRLLQWTRQDLLDAAGLATQEQMAAPIAGEWWASVPGILVHVASVENWYFGHFGLGLDRAQLPGDLFERLRAVRANTQAQFVTLAGDDRVVSKWDELWSARKVLRRTLWHERDHTQQIAQLLAGQ